MTLTLTGIPEVDYQLLLQLDARSIIRLCPVNSYFDAICKDNVFWKNKFERDFGEAQSKIKPTASGWKQAYFDILDGRSKIYAITISTSPSLKIGQLVGYIWVNQNNSKADVYRAALLLAQQGNPNINATWFVRPIDSQGNVISTHTVGSQIAPPGRIRFPLKSQASWTQAMGLDFQHAPSPATDIVTPIFQ